MYVLIHGTVGVVHVNSNKFYTEFDPKRRKMFFFLLNVVHANVLSAQNRNFVFRVVQIKNKYLSFNLPRQYKANSMYGEQNECLNKITQIQSKCVKSNSKTTGLTIIDSRHYVKDNRTYLSLRFKI